MNSSTAQAADGRTVASAIEVRLWLTPKVFTDLTVPEPDVESFFDHYAAWVGRGDRLVPNFCAGNGDHVLAYRGRSHRDESFDWARYNCYAGSPAAHRAHNRNWSARVREGGERSFNPYSAGPAFLTSDQAMDYHVLAGIYSALRAAARARGSTSSCSSTSSPGPSSARADGRPSGTRRERRGRPTPAARWPPA